MSVLLEKIYSRLLIESTVSTEGLAAYVEKSHDPSVRAITIYDYKALIKILRSIKLSQPETEWIAEDVLPHLRDSMKGYIEIQKASSLGHGRCYDSWEVRFSAGPKIGSLVYGLGFAMTDNGKLTSDRYQVSPGALNRWTGEKKSRESTGPFDNINDPKTPSDRDDCIVFKDDDPRAAVVNVAYKEIGWEKSALKLLEKRHELVKESMLKLTGPTGEQIFTDWDLHAIEINLPYYGSEFFNAVYR